MPDYTPHLYASISVTLTFATLVLGLRLYARRITRAGYGLDDGLAVIGFIGSLAFTIVALVWTVDYGLGRPIQNGPPSLTIPQRLSASWLLLFCSSVTYSIAIAFTKLAILTFYWRIFKFSSIRIPIQILLGITIAWFITRLCMVLLQCIPIQARWDPDVEDAHCGIKESAFFFATGLTHVVIDVAILVLPAVEVGKMRLPRGQKVGVIALFGSGTLTCVASVFVLIESARFNSRGLDLPHELGRHIAWATAEVNLACISASLPMLRPVIRKLLPNSLLTSHTSGNDNSGRHLQLLTITRSKESNAHAGISMPQLADAECGSFGIRPCGMQWPRGPQTTIWSAWKNRHSSDDDERLGPGIHARDEMVVHVEHLL